MPSSTDNLNLYLPDAGQSGVAAQLNTNWSTLDARFDEASGHTHDGSEGEGPKIPVTSLSTTGTASSSTYLRGDGQWATGTGGTGGVTDHGDLTGLADDDHPQYMNQGRGDARYAQRTNNLSDLTSAATARTNLGAAAAAHTHAGADITTGTVPTARLGSGTASTSTYLRGDQTWATVSGSGGAGTLDDLTDVLIVTPSDGQLLRYNATATRWENATVATGGGGGTWTGYLPYCLPINYDVSTTNILTGDPMGVGLARLVPFALPAPMRLVSVSVMNRDTTLERSWQWRLYAEPVGGGGTLDEVAGANGTETFTATAASKRTAACASVVTLVPGVYWLAVRNSHASNTFIGAVGAGGTMVGNLYQTKSIGALGATLDATTGWTRVGSVWGAILNGAVFGQATAF